MAIYKIYPEKDASIYSEFPSRNTGLDSILEASNYQSDGSGQVSRYLIKFSTNQISDIYNNKISGQDYKVFLKNFKAVITGINLDRILEFYPISGDWGMGTGHFNDSPEVTNGCSWVWRDYSGSIKWPTSSFGTFITASFPDTNKGGGNWYTGSNLSLDPVTQSQTFTYADNKDIVVDVTNTVETWYSYSLDSSNGFPNQGFIVKQTDSNEFVNNLNNNAIFRFFSIDTNTIYPPQLEFRYNDYIFNTGSSTNTILPDVESFISIYNNREVYYSESIPRFRITAIPKYPDRQFLTASLYTTNYYLPESQSLYAIKDTSTNEYVIDFDSEYTRISADATSSYFDLHCNGLEPERYYTILIKTTINGVVKVFNEDIRFKVANG